MTLQKLDTVEQKGRKIGIIWRFGTIYGLYNKKGKYNPLNDSGNIEYSLDIGGKFLKIISKPGSNSITTISF